MLLPLSPPIRAPRVPCRGVTFAELLVVIVLGAVLAVIAIPSMVSSLQRNSADAAANQLVASMALARSEAIKLGCQVNVSSTVAGNDWSGGWSVTPTCPVPAAAGAVIPALRTTPAFAAPLKVFGTTASLGFDATGRLAGVGYTSEFDFLVCADGATNTYPSAQGVTVVASGRVRLADNNKTSQVPQTNKLVAMTCAAPPA